MVESNTGRNKILDLLFYNVAASTIMIIGVSAFSYVGERMSHGSSKIKVAIEAPAVTP